LAGIDRAFLQTLLIAVKLLRDYTSPFLIPVATPAASGERSNSMSETDNRRLTEEAYSALNAHDLDRYAKGLDDSYAWDSDAFPAPVRGPEGAKQALALYFKAFPDLHFEVEQIIASGDFVVSRWRATGTHKGEFSGIPATNKQVNTRGCTVSELRSNRFVKASMYFDQLSLFSQLGVAILKATGAAS
jgi:steroid delta-isomerase-like uncharacterized protein